MCAHQSLAMLRAVPTLCLRGYRSIAAFFSHAAMLESQTQLKGHHLQGGSCPPGRDGDKQQGQVAATFGNLAEDTDSLLKQQGNKTEGHKCGPPEAQGQPLES